MLLTRRQNPDYSCLNITTITNARFFLELNLLENNKKFMHPSTRLENDLSHFMPIVKDHIKRPHCLHLFCI